MMLSVCGMEGKELESEDRGEISDCLEKMSEG